MMNDTMMNNNEMELDMNELEQISGGGKLGKKLRAASVGYGVAAGASALTGVGAPVGVGCGIIWAGLNVISWFC